MAKPPDNLSDDDRKWLGDFGFSTGPSYSHDDSFIAHRFGVRENRTRRPAECTTTTVPTHGRFTRRLVEVCCGSHSTLGRFTDDSSGCDCVRIDIELDVSKPSTRKLIHDALCCKTCAIWISLPCTGGSAWNTWNSINVPKSRPGIDEKVKWFSHNLKKSGKLSKV